MTTKEDVRTEFWSGLWEDILVGGRQLWKVNDIKAKQNALSTILKHTCRHVDKSNDDNNTNQKLSILCPLAGDDLFVSYAWSQGHSVTAIDLVPEAVAKMRKQFVLPNKEKDDDEEEDGEGGDKDKTDSDAEWTKTERDDGMVQWDHSSGRAVLFQGNVFTVMDDLKDVFDAVYDKDSFGALEPTMRSKYCDRLADYLKPGGIVYTEVKNKSDDLPTRFKGPPYHLEKADLMEESNYGRNFDHVTNLGELYEISMPGMKQTGHILKHKETPADGSTTPAEKKRKLEE